MSVLEFFFFVVELIKGVLESVVFWFGVLLLVGDYYDDFRLFFGFVRMKICMLIEGYVDVVFVDGFILVFFCE